MIKLSVKTRQRDEFVLLTELIQRQLALAGWADGVLTVFIPHTTAGVTIQENADPDVARDLICVLGKMIAWKDPSYCHAEGNTAAHVKASLLGSSAQVLVENGQLKLGTWQGIFLGEFDGPRNRSVWLTFNPALMS